MADEPKPPFFSLPGFFPDAIPYALRTATALVLAYGIGFYAQLPTTSSAGITVGIVSQPSAGMALSKAFYRILGTVIGCIVSLIFGAAFGQDRTMLLFAFALWMGLCSAAATLLRDFRSYGAALSGYTVAVIAIGGIDDPDGLLLASLNRTAAILLAIGSVALINSLFGGVPALAALTSKLRTERDKVAHYIIDAWEGRGIPDDLALTQRVANITGLETDANYAAAEQINGRQRRRGAQVAIGSLLTVVSASRSIAGVLSATTRPEIRDYLQKAAKTLQGGSALAPAPVPADPFEALLIERTNTALARMGHVDAGIRVLRGGTATLPKIVLRQTHDVTAAFFSAIRAIIAFGLTAAFAVLAGWSGSTLMLVEQAAFVGLLGANPTPTLASKGFLIPLLPISMVVGVVEFTVLPLTSGMVPFGLIVGGLMFVTALLVRHKRFAPFAGTSLLYVTLMLSPTNPANFNLESYLNTTLLVFLSTLFTLLTFLLILPVSPKRRLYRTVAAVAKDLRASRRSDRPTYEPPVVQARLYDRLVRALTYLGKPTGARKALLSHLTHLGMSDIALNRARTGLIALRDAAAPAGPRDRLDPALASALQALKQADSAGMLEAARTLLAVPGVWASVPGQQAVSGLTDLVYQDGAQHRVTRFYKLMVG